MTDRQNSVAPLAYITGASSGIGQAMAWRFYQAGYRLGLVARRTEQVKAWAESMNMGATSYVIYSADVSDIRSIVAADRKSTRLNSSHRNTSRMPSSA